MNLPRLNFSNLEKSQAGFTLIELIIVIALIAIVSLFAAPSISSVFKVSLKSTARELATVSKETFNATALTGRVHRLVFDLDKDEYWSEVSTGDFVQLESEKSIALAERRRKFGLTKKEEAEEKSSQNPFSLAATITRKKKSFARGVVIIDVETEKTKEPQTEGIANAHFFPHGMSEQLLLHIQDTSDHIMSLYIAPVLGRVKLIDGRVSLKEAQEASL